VLEVWLPSLDTFRTFLGDSNNNFPPLSSFLDIAHNLGREALHG